jgi:hypothetical protein
MRAGSRLPDQMSAVLDHKDVAFVDLSQAELRALIEQVGEEVAGVRSFERLYALHREGKIPTGPGANYLNSLLELVR